MTTPKFIIVPSEQQRLYEALIDLAQSYPDCAISDSSCSLQNENLTEADLSSFALDGGQNFTISFQTQDSSLKIVSDLETLTELYQKFGVRDKDKNGKIDDFYLEVPLEIEMDDVKSAFSEMTQRFIGSVFTVAINRDGPVPNGGEGTGWIAARFQNADGSYTYHVITNDHVADEPAYREKPFRLFGVNTTPFGYADVELVGVNPQTDIAVLSFTTKDKLEPLPFEKDDVVPQRGDTILKIGNTLGSGVIPVEETFASSEIGWDVLIEDDNMPFPYYKSFGSTNHGNSGSPVLNDQGRVFAVHNSGDGYLDRRMIPISVVRDSYEKIIAGSNHGVTYGDWGLYTIAAHPWDNKKRVLPEEYAEIGVLVSKVYPGESADKAGLEAGDYILSATDPSGRKTVFKVQREDQMYRFLSVMRNSKAEEKFELDIYRPSSQTSFTTQITAQSLFFGVQDAYETRFGFNVMDIPTSLRRFDDSIKNIQGVLVVSRGDASAPVNPGIRDLYNGMVITHVNHEQTASVEVFSEVFEKALATGTPITLTMIQTTKAWWHNQAGPGSSYDIVLVP